MINERGFETATALKSYVPRTIVDWNNLPDYLRKMDNIKLFKLSSNHGLKKMFQ